MTSLAKLVSISLLFLCSCDTDDSQSPAIDEFPDNILHYDDENHSAPSLTAGRNEVAVKFSNEVLVHKIGKHLNEIRFFIYESPEACQVNIYEGTSGNMPGTIIYSADVVSQLTTNQWNIHMLAEEVEIGNEDLWISVVFTTPSDAQLIGCDIGPQIENGAMILGESDTSWGSFHASVNWNIRGILED